MAVEWRIAGEEVGHCNCDWGCPCQFNLDPTHGNCEAVVAWEIQDGNYGATDLTGTRYARVYSWPGAVHEGNGTRRMIVDESASEEQRQALEALESGGEGGGYFEIFAAVCPNRLDTLYAPIEMAVDREARTGSIRIDGIVESRAEPIRNPVTGDEHRVRIDLPNGFEFKQAEIANTVEASVTAGERLSFTFERTYTQLYEFDWSNA
jgi:hypothetical protein